MAERRLEGSATTSERDIVKIGGHEVIPIPHAEGKTYTLFACIRGAEDGIIQSTTFRASARGDYDAPAPRLKTQALTQMPVDALARGPGPHHTHPSLAFQATLAIH
jgi:hypothetical protein